MVLTIASIIVVIGSAVLGAGIIRSLAGQIPFKLYLILSVVLIGVVLALLLCFFKVTLRTFESKILAIKVARKVEGKLGWKKGFGLATDQCKIEENSLFGAFQKNKNKFLALILVFSGVCFFIVLIGMYFWL